MPGTGFREHADFWAARANAMFDGPFDWFKQWKVHFGTCIAKNIWLIGPFADLGSLFE